MKRTSKQQAEVVKISEIEEFQKKLVAQRVQINSAREKLRELIDLIDVISNVYDHYGANFTFETLLDGLQSHAHDVGDWLVEERPQSILRDMLI